jgi:hypothetical protein
MAVPTAITFLDIKGQDSLILPEAWDAVHELVSSQPLEAMDNGQWTMDNDEGGWLSVCGLCCCVSCEVIDHE